MTHESSKEKWDRIRGDIATREAEEAQREAERQQREEKRAQREAETEAFEAEFGTRIERARESAARRGESEARRQAAEGRRLEAEGRRIENERLRRVREARELYGFEDLLREAPQTALPNLIAFWSGTSELSPETQGFLQQLQGRIGWDLDEGNFMDYLLTRWRSYGRRLRGLIPKGPKAPPTFRSPFASRPG